MLGLLFHSPLRPLLQRRAPAARTSSCCALLSTKKSYYEVLGVTPTASLEEVRAAYRSLAKSLHPDVSQEDDAEEVFAGINMAYAVLSDEEERARYDHLWWYEKERQQQREGAQDGSILSGEEAERAAALERFEEVQREAQRARRMAREARKAAEGAKQAAAAQGRAARRQAMATATATSATASAASTAAATASADAAGVNPVGDLEAPAAPAAQHSTAKGTTGADKGKAARKAEVAVSASGGVVRSVVRTARVEARRAAREATQAARREARGARRQATQLRYWAQWAEQEADAVRKAAGLPSFHPHPQTQRTGRQQHGAGDDAGGAAGGWQPPPE